jgi:hypothetical protein
VIAHLRQLGYEDKDEGSEIYGKEPWVVMGVMGGGKKAGSCMSETNEGEREKDIQADGKTKEPFFGRSILGAVVYLFPESEVVVCAAVKVAAKGDASDAVEHEIGEGEVEEVDESPRNFLCYCWDSVDDDFSRDDEYEVNEPCTWASCKSA